MSMIKERKILLNKEKKVIKQLSYTRCYNLHRQIIL